MSQKHFLSSEIKPSAMTQAKFSVLPVPFENSVSYGSGTARGPQAILEASDQLETLLITADGYVHPCLAGIHTCEALDCSRSAEQVIAQISNTVAKVVHAGSVPVMLGGEHTVTYGAIKGLLSADVGSFGVVQIDAHADLRAAYEGDAFSHASVMRHVLDAGVPLFQLGVRALCDEENTARKRHHVHYIDAIELVPKQIDSIALPETFPEQIYLSFDVDGLDPSVMPATGTPVQGGLGWYQALSLITSIAKQRKIIGFDVVELAPIAGFHAYDFAAAQLVYELMGLVQCSEK